MEDIYICVPGEWVVVSSTVPSKNDGLLCIVQGIKKGKINCEIVSSENCGLSSVLVNPWDLIDSGEFQRDENDDNVDDDNFDTSVNSLQRGHGWSDSSDSGLLSNKSVTTIIKSSLPSHLHRVQLILEAYHNDQVTNEVESQVVFAVTYLEEFSKSHQPTDKSFILAQYYLTQLYKIQQRYDESVGVAVSILKHGSQRSELNNTDLGKLLLFLASIQQPNSQLHTQIETLLQYSNCVPYSAYYYTSIGVLFELLAAQGIVFQQTTAENSLSVNTNPLFWYTQAVAMDEKCIVSRYRLSKYHFTAGNIDQCVDQLTLFAHDHKLKEEEQSVHEAVEVYVQLADLMRTTGRIDSKLIIKTLLRGINVACCSDQQTLLHNTYPFQTKILICNLFHALAVTLEHIGNNLNAQNIVCNGYFISACNIYTICCSCVSALLVNTTTNSALSGDVAAWCEQHKVLFTQAAERVRGQIWH